MEFDFQREADVMDSVAHHLRVRCAGARSCLAGARSCLAAALCVWTPKTVTVSAGGAA